MARADWIRMGYNRLPNILDRVRYASIRQLESKISEAGPPHMRPSPVHLSEAVRQRVGQGDIVVEAHLRRPSGGTYPEFYKPADFDVNNPVDAARRAEVIELYETFYESVDEDQGRTLERVVYNAAQAALRSGKWVTTLGSPDQPLDGLVLGGVPVEAPARPDHGRQRRNGDGGGQEWTRMDGAVESRGMGVDWQGTSP